MHDLSLVTYTYNDHELLGGLLETIRDLRPRPDEVVVVDDGSTEPFRPPQGIDLPLRVIRHDSNRGPAVAKKSGLDAARGRIILSLDSDIRPVPDYPAVSMEHLSRPEVGIVSGPLLNRSGDDLVSSWMAEFGDNYNLATNGPVEFVTGGAFCLRSEVWRAVGGLDGYAHDIGEDHELCRRIRSAGFLLYSDARAVARQVRVLSRRALCRRFWRWFGSRMTTDMLAHDSPPEYIYVACVLPMVERFERILALGKPLWFHLELLYLAHQVYELLGRAPEGGSLAREFGLRFAGMLSPFPRLAAMLGADLAELGHVLPDGDGAGTECLTDAWDEVFVFQSLLEQGGLLRWLESVGVEALRSEAARLRADFSFYETGPSDPRTGARDVPNRGSLRHGIGLGRTGRLQSSASR